MEHDNGGAPPSGHRRHSPTGVVLFYEIRRFQARPGRREEWVRYLEQTVIPFQESTGMSVSASFVDEQDPHG